MMARIVQLLGMIIVVAFGIFCENNNLGEDAGIDLLLDRFSDDNLIDLHDVSNNDLEPPQQYQLKITSLEPSHGPYIGGSEVTIRGRGFISPITIIWDNLPLSQFELIDSHRIKVITPPHPPGYVSVTVECNNQSYTLENGFLYDSFYITPNRGSIAGGTFVTLRGEINFPPDPQVYIGNHECKNTTLTDPNTITCYTPPGYPGTVDVKVVGTNIELVLEDSFTYYDPASTYEAGLSGGEIQGWIDITVFDAVTRERLPQSLVILKTESGNLYTGYTDSRGQITFSGPDLYGRQIITVAHAPVELENGKLMPYETTTVVNFNATVLNILLVPAPVIDETTGTIPSGREPSYITGELLFSNGQEFGPGPWTGIPEPLPGEEKIAYLFVTLGNILSEPPYYPTLEDAIVRRDEVGIRGYRYRLRSPTGSIALFAIAGLYNQNSATFIPYLMGVKRGIVVPPESTVEGVDIYMVHSLDNFIEISLEDPPLMGPWGGPDIYSVKVGIDLGNDGVILYPELKKRSYNPFNRFWIVGLPKLEGELSSATLSIVAGAYTLQRDIVTGQETETNPLSVVIEKGVVDTVTPIIIRGFIGIPYPINPQPGGVVEGRLLEWINNGNQPDFYIMRLYIPGGISPQPYWRVILPGDVSSVVLDDLTQYQGFDEPPDGYLIWELWGIKVQVPNFSFNEWKYRYLSQSYWKAYSGDAWYIRLTE